METESASASDAAAYLLASETTKVAEENDIAPGDAAKLAAVAITGMEAMASSMEKTDSKFRSSFFS